MKQKIRPAKLGDYDIDKQNINKSLGRINDNFPLVDGELILKTLPAGTHTIPHKLRRMPRGIMWLTTPTTQSVACLGWSDKSVEVITSAAGDLFFYIG